MIEFVLSRVWMVICGLALAGVVLYSFGNLDRSTDQVAAVEGARSLAELMEKFQAGGQAGEVDIDVRTLLFDGAHSLRVCNGSVWVVGPSGERAVPGPQGYFLYDDGVQVEELTVRRGDQLRLAAQPSEDGTMSAQLEKVDATSSTASTNRLASVSAL